MNHERFHHSIRDAWSGLRTVFRYEQNFRLQVFIAIGVLGSAWGLGMARSGLVILGCLIVLVLVLEIVNTVVEQLLDVLKPRLHGQVKLIKDMMAGAVFIAALGAGGIGLALFWPYVIEAWGYIVLH